MADRQTGRQAGTPAVWYICRLGRHTVKRVLRQAGRQALRQFGTHVG